MTNLPLAGNLPDNKPLILITNDDSVNTPGIRSLAKWVAHLGTVIVVAPEHPHSGQSSAITVAEPLRVKRHDDFEGIQMWSVSGTPVDCVKLGIHAVLGRRPDLLLAGINHGSNSGINVIYSGTMGAVMEGCICNIPAIGFSYHDHNESSPLGACREVVEKITAKVVEKGLPKGICLNVNIPKCTEVKGIKVVRDACGYWTEEYKEYTDPSGKPFYWLTGSFVNTDPDNPDTDLYWTDRGYASVVPTRPDQSAPDQQVAIANMLELQ
ncbi:MAG: 5'/3'-nucleotidase SurE [Muribaculum sp.]|nr:5'/3'-nucleotidase SurE [Muribaculaceae bacterium]MCM1080126.1 5'/3'-nucleotidase SurE [Muribaculum sp.]